MISYINYQKNIKKPMVDLRNGQIKARERGEGGRQGRGEGMI